MSKGQSIRNRFPLWSSIQKDDSSIGARIFDSLGVSLEKHYQSQLNNSDQTLELQYEPTFEPGFLHFVNLNESVNFGNYYLDNKILRNVTVTGFLELLEEISLERKETYSDFVSSVPTRMEIETESTADYLLLETDEKEIEDEIWIGKKGRQIYIDTNNIDYFISSEDLQYFDTDPKIILRGRNILFEPIEEVIHVKNSGMFKSRNIFTSLEKIERDENIAGGNSISIIGLEGNVKFYTKPFKINGKVIKDIVSVVKYNRLQEMEGRDEAESFFVLKEDERGSYFQKIHRFFEDGSMYKLSDSLEPQENFEDIIWEKYIYSNGSHLLIEDYWWDKVSKRMYTIDNQGIVRIHNLEDGRFQNDGFERTREIVFNIETTTQKVKVGDTERVHIFLERPKGPIYKYAIIKRVPTENPIENKYDDFLFYDKVNKTWVNEVSLINGLNRTDMFENEDSYPIEIEYDVKGEYNFYAICFTRDIEEKKLIKKTLENEYTKEEFLNYIQAHIRNKKQTEIYISKTAVICGSVDTEKEFDVGLGEGSYSIFKESCENALYVISENNKLYKIKEYKDYFYLNYQEGQLATLEKYNGLSLDINYGGFTESIEYD